MRLPRSIDTTKFRKRADRGVELLPDFAPRIARRDSAREPPRQVRRRSEQRTASFAIDDPIDNSFGLHLLLLVTELSAPRPAFRRYSSIRLIQVPRFQPRLSSSRRKGTRMATIASVMA